MNDADTDLAERIVWLLMGPGRIAEFRERLPHRADWQAAIELVRDLLKERKR